jgi:hypothetical protein
MAFTAALGSFSISVLFHFLCVYAFFVFRERVSRRVGESRGFGLGLKFNPDDDD